MYELSRATSARCKTFCKIKLLFLGTKKKEKVVNNPESSRKGSKFLKEWIDKRNFKMRNF